MLTTNRLKLAILITFLSTGLAILFTNNFINRPTHARASGPSTGYTGAPGEATCAECHNEESNGTGRININAPQVYVPGQTYLVTVTNSNTDSAKRRWGFQLTALDEGSAKAGNLESADAFTQILNDRGPGNSRQYVQHTTSGTFSGQQSQASWTFKWTAPLTADAGSVTFHAAGNHADGDNNTSNDHVYFTFVASNPAATTPATLTTNQIENRIWTIDGNTSAYVKLTFPNSSHRVADWGQVSRAGNVFTVDARIERLNDPTLTPQAELSTASIFDLGHLSSGAYTLTVKTSGAVAETHQFALSGEPTTTNPITEAREFVRWQYKDFLNREPDGPGWDYWTGEIARCSDASHRLTGETEAQCVDRKRVNTSGAFFLSTEFQNTGYLVYRFYKGAFARMPKLAEWRTDAQQLAQGIVVNDRLSADVINANKRAFADAFVQRTEFKNTHDSLTNAQYVDRLFLMTGIVPATEERSALINGLAPGGSETRASVLYKIVDGTRTLSDGQLSFETRYGKAFYDQQYNAAFVLMQYFGYLRRDPDDGGYNFWLAKLNRYGNFTDAQMVRAFIISSEYRSRFGQP